MGYYAKGTISANDKGTVQFNRNIIVSSYNDQNKGIYVKISSNKVTVIGQSNMRRLSSSYIRGLDTFITNEITDLCLSEYEYFAVSTNGSSYYYNSSILIIGTRNDTSLKLSVTQSVTTRVGNINATLFPGREYSFVINRLQTVYLSSSDDLTGTRIVTNKPVSVFSGHARGRIFSRYSYIIEQMPPTTSWGNIYYVIPLASRSGYVVKVLAASDCVVNIQYSNDTNFNVSLKSGKSVFKMFSNKKTCVIQSSSKILVVQFSYFDLMMTLVPSITHYNSKITLSTIFTNYWNFRWVHYINIIVLAQYYQPDIIFLKTGETNKSLATQEWVPIKVNNIIRAYGTTINISMGIGEIIHTNKTALMGVIMYGIFTRYGGYGTTANVFNSPLGMQLLCNLCCDMSRNMLPCDVMFHRVWCGGWVVCVGINCNVL